MSPNRLPHVQGLRAVAVLAVVAYHAGLPLPGGFIGVDVFFVISGYVITRMLVREWVTTGSIAIGAFMVRRFRRLMPGLGLMVAVTCGAALLIMSPFGPQQRTAQTGLGAMLLTANAVIVRTTGGYFDAPAGLNPLLHTWSLSVEEQWYLVLPWVLRWLLGRHGSRGSLRTLRVGLAAIGVASFACAVWGAWGGALTRDWLGFYSPVPRAWEFSAGALLATTATRGALRLRAAGAMLGLVLLAAAGLRLDASVAFPGPWTLVPVVGTVLLLIGVGPAARLLAAPPLVWLGDRSYSVYLWHWPALVLAGLLWPQDGRMRALALALAVVIAIGSFALVEDPLRRRHLRSRGMAALVVATLAIPIATASAALATPPTPHPSATYPPASAMHAGYLPPRCHWYPNDGSHDPAPCRWNADATGRPVYLLGDSNAAQYIEGLMAATRTLRRPLVAATSSGCPLLDVLLDGPEHYGRPCLARNQRLLRWIASQPPGTVVLSASDHYWRGGGWSLEAVGRRVRGSAMLPVLQASLTRVVRTLQAHGHDVLLLQTLPHWAGAYSWDPATCTRAQALQGCTATMPVRAALAPVQSVRRLIAQVARRTGARVADLTSAVCPGGTCRTVRNGMPVYRDAKHVTVAMSEALAPDLARLLR